MPKDSIFEFSPNFNYSEEPTEVDASEVEKAMRSRRSIRIFTDEKIPEEVTRRCLSLALLAPNSSNLQPWEFYWVKSPEKRKLVERACLGQNAAKTAAELIVCVGRTKTFQQNCRQVLKTMEESGQEVLPIVRHYYEKLAPFAYTQGPFGILGWFKRTFILPVIGLKKPIPRSPSSLSDMRLWAAKSTALACQNMMLAFRAYGYDTCPMEGLDEARMRRALKLPRDAVVVMAIGAGKRSAKGVYGPQLRFPEEQFLFEV